MFYATYKDVVDSCKFDEIAEFQTKEERDIWVNTQNCFFEREPINDLEFLGIDLADYIKVENTFISNIQWYVTKDRIRRLNDGN